MGSIALVKDQHRAARSFAWMEDAISDVRQSVRSLCRAPAFTAVAVLTVALGIGATVAIFSLVNAALLRPLPYADPEQLARIYVDAPDSPDQRLRRFRAATTEYFQLVGALQSWQGLDAWQTGGANFAGAGEPTRVTSTAVTGGSLRFEGCDDGAGGSLSGNLRREGDRVTGQLDYQGDALLARVAFDLTVRGVHRRTSLALTRSMAYHPEVEHEVAEMRIALEAIRRPADPHGRGLVHRGSTTAGTGR